MSEFKLLELKKITADPGQPRQFYDAVAMEELTQSVKEKGILQPILVRPAKQGYQIVCGERRYRAAIAVMTSMKDRNTIPAMIKELSDEEALEHQIIENLQRKDVHPMEEAVAFKSLLDKRQMTVEEIAARVGKKDYFVKQRLKLNELSKKWQEIFYHNKLSLTTALQICVFDSGLQDEVYKDKVSEHQLQDEDYQVRISDWTFKKLKGDLKEAAFDLTDPSLNKKMGPCTSCKYNTAVSSLFPEDVENPRCLFTTCMLNKSSVHFDRELKKATEDPSIILINESYYNKEEIVKKLEKEGHQILSGNDYSTIDAHEVESWEEYKDDYYDEDDEDSSLDKVKADYEKRVKEFEKDKAEYEKKIASGKYPKAFIVQGHSKGAYVYIELKKGKKITTQSVLGDPGTAEIKDEITRIKDREKRAKDLDQEKVYAKVMEIIKNSKGFVAEKRNMRLSKAEVIGSIVALHEAGSIDFMKLVKKEFDLNRSDYYTMTFGDIKKLQEHDYTEFAINRLLLHFILDKLLGQAVSPLTNGKAAAILEIAKEHHSNDVNLATIEQEERAEKRGKNVQKKIAELEAKIKELKSASAPAKKSPSKSKV